MNRMQPSIFGFDLCHKMPLLATAPGQNIPSLQQLFKGRPGPR